MKCLQKYLEGIGKTDWLNRSDNKGLSEPELRKKLIAEEHKRLSDNLNTLKKAVNPKTKPEKYSAPKEPETTDIEKDFENKKIELENKYSQLKKGGENAIQEQSTESVLQYPQETVGETGSKRTGVESGEQGETTSTTRTETPEEKITEPQGGTPPPTGEQPPLIGKKVDAAFAGGKISGEVIDDNGARVKIRAKDGTIYPVKYKDILKEGETLKEHYDKEVSSAQNKVYEELIGARPNNNTARIPVDPIVGGTAKKLSDILFDVSKALGKKVTFLRLGRRKALGTYSPSNAVVKIKFSGDLDTTAHELGHSIDDHFGILSDLKNNPNSIIENELKPFSKHGSTPPQGHPDKRMYKLGEGFAEWLRAFIVNPKEAKKAAPEVYKLYESKVSDNFKNGVETFSNDIRTWAASSGRDMVLSNLEWKPEDKSENIISKIFKKSANDNMFEINWSDKVAANYLNPLHVFEKSIEFAKGLKGVDELLPENNPSVLARLLLSIDRKYGDFLEHGLHDANDKPILDKDGNPKTFDWLLKPLDNTDEATIKKEMEDTLAYMIAERTVELGKKFDRDEILTGIGGGIYKDMDVAKKVLDEFNNGDADKLARIKEAADRYRSFANDILDYLADKGRIEKEKLDKEGNLVGGAEFIKKNNLQYIALNRILEAAPNEPIEMFTGESGKLGSVYDPIKAIKGSTRKIKNPYVSLLDQMYKSIKEADRNDVLRQYRDLLVQDRGMYEGKPSNISDVGFIAKEGDPNAISIFVNGKVEKWKFNPEIYKALKGLDNDGYKLPGILTLHARVLRNTVTKFPVFAARNWVRDFQDRIVKSDSGFRNLWGDKKHWQDVARNGGLNAGYYMKGHNHYYGLMEEAIKELAKNKKSIIADPSKFTKVWHSYEAFLTKSETANRVAEYRKAFQDGKKKGFDDYNATLYAATRSRGLIDFALMGHYMKIINQIIPFSNAAVQGIRSTVVRAMENPKAFTSRLAAYVILPQVALWVWNHKNKDDADEYESLPSYQRDMFWNIKIGDNKWASIPKAFELGLLGSGVDRGLSKLFGYNNDAFEGYAGSAAQAVIPFDLGSMSAPFQPLVEADVNKNFYTGKNIIPERENALDLSLRNTETASRLGQFLQTYTGIDARKLDYIIKSQFSYVGKTALEASDIGREESRNKFGLKDLGFFNQSPAYSSAPVQKLIQTAEMYGLKNSIEYKSFNDVVEKYFDAKTDNERDKLAKEMVQKAKQISTNWEKEDIRKVVIAKKQAKEEELEEPSFTDETINKYPSLKYMRDTLNVPLSNVQYGNHTIPIKGIREPVKISTLPQDKQDAYKSANVEEFSKELGKVTNRGYLYVNEHDSVKEKYESGGGYKRYYFDEEKFKKDKSDFEKEGKEWTAILMTKEQKEKYLAEIQKNIQNAANDVAKDKIFGKEYNPTDSTKNK